MNGTPGEYVVAKLTVSRQMDGKCTHGFFRNIASGTRGVNAGCFFLLCLYYILPVRELDIYLPVGMA